MNFFKPYDYEDEGWAENLKVKPLVLTAKGTANGSKFLNTLWNYKGAEVMEPTKNFGIKAGEIYFLIIIVAKPVETMFGKTDKGLEFMIFKQGEYSLGEILQEYNTNLLWREGKGTLGTDLELGTDFNP